MRDYWEPVEWDDDYKSRSQKKRESTAMQNIGEDLAALSESELNSLSLSPTLLRAVLDWKKLKKHEALRRQMQYIGRLMREEPEENAQRIQDFLAEKKGMNAQSKETFHQTEAWRDKLINEKSRAAALDELLNVYPDAPQGQIRHILELADSNNPTNSKKGSRELFRLLKAIFEDAN